MNSKRLSAIVTGVVATVFLVLNLSQDTPESYQFPTLLAIILCGLSLLFLLSTFTYASAADGERGGMIDWVAIWPGIVVGIAYYLCLETLGFYSASYLAFLFVIVFYDKSTMINVNTVLIKSLVAALFIAALYGLFYYALHVQAPRGILF